MLEVLLYIALGVAVGMCLTAAVGATLMWRSSNKGINDSHDAKRQLHAARQSSEGSGEAEGRPVRERQEGGKSWRVRDLAIVREFETTVRRNLELTELGHNQVWDMVRKVDSTQGLKNIAEEVSLQRVPQGFFILTNGVDVIRGDAAKMVEGSFRYTKQHLEHNAQ